MDRDKHTRLVNLTGHPVTLLGPWDQTTLPVDGKARVNSDMKMVDRISVGGFFVPILEVREQYVENLPEPIDGVVYVVSGIVAHMVRERDDVVTLARVDRDDEGVHGARALMRIRGVGGGR